MKWLLKNIALAVGMALVRYALRRALEHRSAHSGAPRQLNGRKP
jgi:hypothetical protein